MSDKKKKDIPAQEPENENTAPVTEETANTEAAVEETAPETFTVTKEQMEKMEGLAKLVADVNDKYRKRTAKEKESIYGDAKADTIKPLLAVYDNLERGIAQYDEADVHRQGLELILRQFSEALTKLGVTEIEAKGQPFDPEKHNAVMHVEDEEAGENTVVEVFQKGFMLGDKVLRFAMVKVAN